MDAKVTGKRFARAWGRKSALKLGPSRDRLTRMTGNLVSSMSQSQRVEFYRGLCEMIVHDPAMISREFETRYEETIGERGETLFTRKKGKC